LQKASDEARRGRTTIRSALNFWRNKIRNMKHR
jgi:hypothetical protein